MSLTPDQIERYKRHILIPEIGGLGQQKLLKAKVLVVGAGGLGCPILSYLSAAGIGTIGICDEDVVSLSNLQRQILFTTDDIGKPKVLCAQKALQALNPGTKTVLYRNRISLENVGEIIENFDLVIEGVDNFETRYILNEECLRRQKPLISAAIGKFDGQIATFKAWQENAPCYRCFVPEAPTEFQDCQLEGVIGAIPGIVGTLAAMEVIKEVTGLGESLAGHVLLVSGLTGEARRIRLKRDPECSLHFCDANNC